MLSAGAVEIDTTPEDSQFLFGYPHVERYSTGVHDPLICSALVLHDGEGYVAFVTCDIIFVDKVIVASARERIASETPIPGANIFVSATHTHSGPLTVDHASNADDPIVPKADQAYRRKLEDAIVEAVTRAFGRLAPARVGLAVGDATGVGTNRRDPSGPADLTVPVLYVTGDSGEPVACMVVCSMHPTVLHEDSTLVSADFPGFARDYVKRELGANVPFLYHTGPAGNQSPRHVTRANTFDEAKRLGEIVGRAVVGSLGSIETTDSAMLSVVSDEIGLPARSFPPVAEAKAALEAAADRLEALRNGDASPQEIRTAEVDWFGAEETLTLARASAEGKLARYINRCLPAEIMIVSVGEWRYVGIPGEMFIEYSLEIKERCPNTFVVSLANGELQGYIVTAEAAELGGYEASNAMFHYTSGAIMVKKAVELLGCG